MYTHRVRVVREIFACARVCVRVSTKITSVTPVPVRKFRRKKVIKRAIIIRGAGGNSRSCEKKKNEEKKWIDCNYLNRNITLSAIICINSKLNAIIDNH
ncbi:hypothetical protein PUN28_006793 [Cardiocondyla obscurior]|uniref:Uncharacterized protein n=1 Tax=Cardiocondyla obscurior TaxID=286306 RepID=A0AAW2G376_9HYME